MVITWDHPSWMLNVCINLPTPCYFHMLGSLNTFPTCHPYVNGLVHARSHGGTLYFHFRGKGLPCQCYKDIKIASVHVIVNAWNELLKFFMSQEYIDVGVEMKFQGLFYVDGIAIIGQLGQQHDRCTDPCRDRYKGVVHWGCSYLIFHHVEPVRRFMLPHFPLLLLNYHLPVAPHQHGHQFSFQ